MSLDLVESWRKGKAVTSSSIAMETKELRMEI